jgi:metaxin
MGEQKSSWFQLPEVIRELFSRFPLRTYSASLLPAAATSESRTLLYLWQDRRSASDPSCNPACLKYQALLRFHDIRHAVRSSNNHSSPSGSLPFLIPAATPRPSSPITASKIPKWITSQSKRKEVIHPREEAYTALIDHDIRLAWLYFLYLDRDNFDQVAFPLYCSSASSNVLVQKSLAWQLKSAARDELLKTAVLIDSDELYDRAAAAFQALSTLLGNEDHFFGEASPGLFDASVFAYTHLLLDESMNWASTVLADSLRQHDNLVGHRDRLLTRYFA